MKMWNVVYTDEFGEWWRTLEDAVQDKCLSVVGLLERKGPALGFPYSSDIRGASPAMRELRIQYAGHPYRILYAFDPERSAVLIIGGDKTGDDSWYDRYVPRAEAIFKEYLEELKEVN